MQVGIALVCRRFYSNYPKKTPWKALFFGTDEFSVYSLAALTAKYRHGTLGNLEVVSTIKGKPNPVVAFSRKEHLKLHSWTPLLNPAGEFDVGFVVSFGHLIPDELIQRFQFGILNVHASLLPRWRGAAPIIYSLANGDTETGVTIMRIRPAKFDIGDIILQKSTFIENGERMRSLHARLGILGAQMLGTVLESLPEHLQNSYQQPVTGVCYAPKVKSSFARVQWSSMTSEQIVNLDRSIDGLYNLQTTWKDQPLKLLNISTNFVLSSSGNDPGYVEYDREARVLKILCCDKKILLAGNVSILGKRVMTAQDFNNGYIKKEPPDLRYFK